MMFKRLNDKILWRVCDNSPAHVTVEFLVPFGHPYKVGRWHDDVKCLGSSITRDRKWVRVTYIGVKDLYDGYSEFGLINKIISMVYEY